jgi:hypothetical protein
MTEYDANFIEFIKVINTLAIIFGIVLFCLYAFGLLELPKNNKCTNTALMTASMTHKSEEYIPMPMPIPMRTK